MSELFIKHLELIALLLQPFDAAWQCCAQFVDAAQRVVEGDDGAVAHVTFDIFEDIISIEASGVVACDKVPHDDGVVSADAYVLLVAHPSSWGTEEVGVYVVVCFIGIAQVARAGDGDAPYVVVCVVAKTVAVIFQQLVQFGVLPDVVAYHEEGGFYAIAVKRFDNPRCGFWNGAVIESQVDCFLVRIHAPYCAWIEPSEPFTWLFYNHRVCLIVDNLGLCVCLWHVYLVV